MPLQSFSLCIASCSALFHRLPPATTYKIYALPCCQPFLETEQGLWWQIAIIKEMSIFKNSANSILSIYFQTRKQVGSSKRPNRLWRQMRRFLTEQGIMNICPVISYCHYCRKITTYIGYSKHMDECIYKKTQRPFTNVIRNAKWIRYIATCLVRDCD